MFKRHCGWLGLLLLWGLCSFNVIAASSNTTAKAVKEINQDVSINAGMDISVHRYLSAGSYLMLWFAPEYGFRESHRVMARAFSAQGVEIWQVNMAEALFLPQSTNSLRHIDPDPVADLIEMAHRVSGKKIVLVGDSYAANVALLGAHRWQQRQHKTRYLVGAVLFSPYALAYIPPLGQAPKFLPVIHASNIPVMIVQAKNSGIYGYFKPLVAALRKHDAPVYIRLVDDMMSLFYVEPPTAAMQSQIEPLASSIKSFIRLLAHHPVPNTVPSLPSRQTQNNGIDIALKPFRGKFAPIAITLSDVHGVNWVHKSYRGKVTLVNFWATWCPPCVQEIPMLNRLKIKMQGRPFELISVNYAEGKQAVVNFMKKVKVDFPVLIDHNGEFARRWQVVSYPSTFVIGPDGNIAYGVNAAIDWDSPDVLEALQALYH